MFIKRQKYGHPLVINGFNIKNSSEDKLCQQFWDVSYNGYFINKLTPGFTEKEKLVPD